MLIGTQPIHQRPAWNTGRIIGPKPSLKPRHIWAIRTRLQHEHPVRDLAMFNLAIDSKLRGCDLVRLRVGDVVLGGTVRLGTSIIQQKTGRPVPFELTAPTREARTAWLRKRPADRPTAQWLGRSDRPRPRLVRDAQFAADESCLDLQAHRQSSRLSAPPGALQTGKHRTLPWHRS